MTQADLEEDFASEVENARHADHAPGEEDTGAEPLQQLTEEVQKYKDLYLRAMAETENVRTRAKREAEDTAKYASTKFARDMVGIIDNLQRAADSIGSDARQQSEVLRQVGEGLDMSLQELLSVFERHGIKRIVPLAEKFDHNLHQAVAQIPGGETPAGHVVQVLQAGYKLHDRLLKPAMVTVAATGG